MKVCCKKHTKLAPLGVIKSVLKTKTKILKQNPKNPPKNFLAPHAIQLIVHYMV